MWYEWGVEKYRQCFGGKSLKERDHLEDIGIYIKG
jgi:hypothetical protein